MAQEPYNLFAQQKQQYYPNAQRPQQPQPVVPGQVQGETVDQFVQGRQAANSQTGAVSQPVVTPVNTGQGGGAVMAGGTQYGQQTGGVARTTQPIRSMDDLVSAMYTDPQQDEKLRKASVANQRIMAVGDALRHIGNIFNTVNYAPSQQFNRPWEEERNRYLQEKAYRDKRNQIYMTYQQQKAAQDAKQRQWEQQFKYNMAKDAANFALKKNESEARQQRQKALAALDDARLKGQLDKNTYQTLVNQYYPENAEARIREIESRISKNNRTGTGRSGGRGGKGMDEYTVTSNTEYTYNADGTRTGSKTTKTRTVNGKQQPTQTTQKKAPAKKKALPGQSSTNQQKTKKKLP